ncbi:MAG: hypothetical protein JWN68_1737 [Nocardioides sp.]|jgi:hypothetical protein|nr:hypothetical protein [Nocardioides sp.]MCW2833784.1 hypothetical protein [Nocardioides sp.]
MGFQSLTADEASTLPGFNDYLEGKPLSAQDATTLAHAGIFHRVFRDRMR